MKSIYGFYLLALFLPQALFGSEEQQSEQQVFAADNAVPAQAQQQMQKKLVFTNAHNASHPIHLSYCLRDGNQAAGATAQHGSCWIRRVLIPGEVLYIEEALNEILWRRESEVSRLLLPNFQRGRVSFDANGRFSMHNGDAALQTPLRVRGTDELKKFFPALWSQEPTLFSDVLTSISNVVHPLLGQTKPVADGASEFHCQEIQQKITECSLSVRHAACRILALEDDPTEREIDHAFESKLKDVSQSFSQRGAVLHDGNSVDQDVIKTLFDAKNVLDAFGKEQKNFQAGETVNVAMSDTICINQTDTVVYLAPYCRNTAGSVIRVPGVDSISIPPFSDALVPISRVKAPGGKPIEFFVAETESALCEALSAEASQNYAHSTLMFSSVFSNSYYIIKDKETGTLTIMPLIEYGTKYCRKFSSDPKQLQGVYDCRTNGRVHPFDDQMPEAGYLEERLPRVKAAYESFLQAEGILQTDEKMEEDHLPRVGFAFTGGGYRAMIKTAGCCAAAEEMFLVDADNEGTYAVHDHSDDEKEEECDEGACGKLLPDKKGMKGSDKVSLIDAAMYMSGLSGSTWALSSYFDARSQYGNSLTFNDFGSILKPRVMFNAATFPPTLRDIAFYAHIISTKSRYAMPAYDFVGNCYAYHLAKRLLWGNEDYRHYRHLSDLKDAVDGTIPFPLLTTVTTDGEDLNEPKWLEFSPFHVGTSCGARYWTDSRFFGRQFLNGETTQKGMEEYLGYIMAICGSAYAAHLPGIRDRVPLGGYLPNPESGESILASRAAKPVAYNFTVGLERPMGRTTTDPHGQDVIGYIDGAHDKVTVGNTERRHNFATIPLLARGLDIIIMCDAVREMSTTHLLAAKARAEYFGLPFPKYREGGIDSPQIFLNNMQINQATLWVDPENLDAPVIVYIAIMKDDSFDATYDPSTDASTHTANFWYTGEQYDKLYGLSKHVFATAEPVIKEALKIAYERNVAKSRMTATEQAERTEQALLEDFSVLPEPVMSSGDETMALEAYAAQCEAEITDMPPAEARPLTSQELCDWPDDYEIFHAEAAQAHEQLHESDHGPALAEGSSESHCALNAEHADDQGDHWDDFDLV